MEFNNNKEVKKITNYDEARKAVLEMRRLREELNEMAQDMPYYSELLVMFEKMEKDTIKTLTDLEIKSKINKSFDK